MTSTKTINILLVDDHQIVLEGLKKVFNATSDIVVVGEVTSAKKALEALKELSVDLILTDINMPETSGIELIKQVKQLYPDIKTLALTMHKEYEFIKAVIDAEGDGYLLKNADKEKIIRAVHHVANDGTHYDNEIVSILNKANNKTSDNSLLKELSERELSILKLICKEYSSEQIAEQLFISRHTVDTHRRNILKKTTLKNSISLIRYIAENNLLQV